MKNMSVSHGMRIVQVDVNPKCSKKAQHNPGGLESLLYRSDKKALG